MHHFVISEIQNLQDIGFANLAKINLKQQVIYSIRAV